MDTLSRNIGSAKGLEDMTGAFRIQNKFYKSVKASRYMNNYGVSLFLSSVQCSLMGRVRGVNAMHFMSVTELCPYEKPPVAICAPLSMFVARRVVTALGPEWTWNTGRHIYWCE